MTDEAGHILIVDDNLVNRKLLSRVLEEQGHTVATAEHGAQALELVHIESFDVVLLDILMPEMDGYQLLANMKDDPGLRHLPVIMISAVDEMDSVVRCIQMGATDYLHKPFNASLLRARINASLATKRMHDMARDHLREVQAYLAQIEVEQEKSERLLLNILPIEIADILKTENRTIADQFDEASVLFADMVGFTPMSARMKPVETVELLNEVFSHFDSLVEKYDLEKIRTIGDSYMVASGVPSPRKDHAQGLARMALEMHAYAEHLQVRKGNRIRFRIGINSGPLVAGVIGQKKFHYDVWGDMVNTASRMESHGVAGKTQISHDTYLLLNNEFICEPRGKMAIKGKGKMDTWFLIAQKQ